ncbi:MAG: phosphate starvation-inducible [Chlamydiales bacterium]|nr:phosphate starvation-inducible [Chlamydiales bacterium]
MPRRKTFVIDTNVLLHDPEAILKFPRGDIIIPLTVLEELDEKKRLPGELGRNARAVVRLLASLKGTAKGNLHDGVKLENGSSIRIMIDAHLQAVPHLSLEINDNKIILAGHLLAEKGQKVIFVSKDFAARLKAEAVGLEAQDYENLKFAYHSIYRGIRALDVQKDQIDLFYKDGFLSLPKESFKANEFCVLSSSENASATGKYSAQRERLEFLNKPVHLWGVKPRNMEQKCALDLLLRDEIKLVTLIGQAGTGKTLLALAAGMRKVFDEATYSKIFLSRPIVPLGRDIGYLPGTKEEKLSHWMQPIYDNLEFLCGSHGSEPSETLQWVMNSKKIEMEAVTYIRGRSLPNVYFIIDEAQNLTPHEIKTIISRAGEGTKVILTGDPTQIDNPYLDKDSNGLTYVVGKFQNQPLYGHICLEKTERSELAALAVDIL